MSAFASHVVSGGKTRTLMIAAALVVLALLPSPRLMAADAAAPAAVPAFAERLAAADLVRGRVVFGACRTCHYPDRGAGHQNGPSLWSIFGKQAGMQAGFAYYSQALKDSGLVWSPAYLDAWLDDPSGFMPGNMMMSLGVHDPQDRADLIAYLMLFRETPTQSPPP
jgi:cytochrome c